MKKENNNNYIIAEIYIKEENINKKIRIINSYEEYRRNYNLKIEDEIKKCVIKINNELIPFKYFYKFKSKGKYIIQYSFKNNINKTCCMFSDCSSLTNINLSNFNSNNVTNMRWMFFGCSSLTNINLSNLNINNVSKMESIFWGCSSLKKENIISNDETIRDIKINQPTITVKIIYDLLKDNHLITI